MDSAVGELAPQHRIVIRAGESFFLNDLEIAPFSIPHDAADPVGYRIFARDHSVAVATDLGYFSQDVRDAITGADLVLLESNHEPRSCSGRTRIIPSGSRRAFWAKKAT